MKEFTRAQFAAALANILGTNREFVEDIIDEFDLPDIADAGTFAEARDEGDGEHLRWDPTGNATGVIVHMGDGTKVRVIVEKVG